jgi:Tfp pilus assembly protein PilF
MIKRQRRTGARGWLGVAALTALCLLGSCASRSGPYRPIDPARRDTVRAQQLSQEAAEVMTSDPTKAEALLREALTADLYLGPAHNNLGVVFLNRGDLYQAAGEFEWARKLMPGRPDPRMNLALTLERAGRTDEALSAYASALEVEPTHIETTQALTRLQVRSGRSNDQTRANLDEISLRGTTELWRTWASQQRMKGGEPPGSRSSLRIK